MMSKSNDLLSKITKNFIFISGHHTLIDALSSLQQQNGQDSWFLVVELGEGQYLASRFSELQKRVKAEGQSILSIPLKDLGIPFVPIETVKHNTDLPEAVNRANSSPTKSVLVTWDNALIGVLTTGESYLDLAENAASKEVEQPQEKDKDTASVDVSIDGDVNDSQVNIAAGDVINITQLATPSLEGGPKWLIQTVSWVRGNVILTILGFLVFVLFPTVWLVSTEVIPSLNPATRPRMAGEWNVAVAGFTSLGDETISREDADSISVVFYNRLKSEMESLSGDVELTIDVWGPKEAGVVMGATPEERAINAEKLARNINAHVVIYGTVQQVGTALQLQPEFYVRIENNYEANDLIGQYAFGDRIPILGSGENLSTQIPLNSELSQRAQALALVTRGLSYYSIYRFEEASKWFEKANNDEFWRLSDNGREVIYHFQGNSAEFLSDLDNAEEYYQKALEIEPQFARSYLGMGSISYLRSLEAVDESSALFEPNMELLDQALQYYEEASRAKIQSPTADVPVKVASGKGHVFLAKWFAGQDTLAQAIEQLEFVIEAYGEGDEVNARLSEYAAEANARMGLIKWEEGNIEAAIPRYITAWELSIDPKRKALFSATLADMYEQTGQPSEAEVVNRRAIDEYTTALSLVYQEELRAKLWAAIATRYKQLGEIDEAVKAFENALNQLPDDSENRQFYLNKLNELK